MTDRVRTLLPVLLALGLSACWPAGTLEKRKTVTDHQRERAEAAREGGPVAALPRPPVEVLPEGRDPAVKPGEEALAVDLQALAEACRGGGASACLTLGLIKDQGVGVSPDPAAAADLYRQACDRGEALACTSLGALLEAGRGVPADTGAAVQLYEAACQAGEARACSNLGMLLELGDGVAEDPDRAVALYRNACQGGAMTGCANLAVAWEEGLIVEEDVLQARDLFRQACDGGFLRACARLAGLHARGCLTADGAAAPCPEAPEEEADLAARIEALCDEQGVPVACAAAAAWIVETGGPAARAGELDRKACDGGEPWGCTGLARRLREENQLLEAMKLYQAACDRGFLLACREAGEWVAVGNSPTIRDEAAGTALLRRACRPEATTFCPDLLYYCAMGVKGACEAPAQ